MSVRQAIVALLLSGAVCSAALGGESAGMPPGHDDPANNPTSQKWLPQPFGEPPIPGEPLPPSEPLPPGDIPPSEPGNPFGEPSVSLGDGWESEWSNPPGTNPDDPFEPIPTWHYDDSVTGGNGELKINLPNGPEQREYKLVWYRIISDKSPSDAAREVTVDLEFDPPVAPGDVVVNWHADAYVSEQLGASADGGSWYRYEGMVEIRPNPQHESLTFEILGCTNIAEIEVRTVCVPEPATMSLLALGGLAGLIRRKR